MERRLAESRTAELRTAEPRVMVNGQPRELGEVGGHVTLLDWLRGQRADRRQGGLRRGRVRRLRGAGGPARTATARTRWTAINACLVPAARSTARRS